MIQKKYLCKDYSEAENTIAQINDVLSGTEHKSALLTFYEVGLTSKEAESLVSLIKKDDHPELKIYKQECEKYQKNNYLYYKKYLALFAAFRFLGHLFVGII